MIGSSNKDSRRAEAKHEPQRCPVDRRTLLQTAGVGLGGLAGVAETTTAQSSTENQSETVMDRFSFEDATPGAGQLPSPWSVVQDPTADGFNSVEISDQHATDGAQTLHMSGNG